MENSINKEEKSFLETVLDNKGPIFIFSGMLIRLFMFFFYLYIHTIEPGRSWGDIGINYKGSYYYPPFTMMLLGFFRNLSFGMVEIFAFWGFLLDIITMVMFYYVITSFNLPNKEYVFGLFLINPFLFLNNSFSLENCGYHITDAFFFFFLFMALIFYPKKEVWNRYLFYIFLALSAVAKLYTLPVIGFFFLKFLIEKDWKNMKIFLISTIPIIFIFIVSPIFYWEDYLRLYSFWNQRGEAVVPLFIRLIPSAIICVIYILFSLKKADLLELTFVSILVMAVFMFFSNPYMRYFQALLFFGILKTREFFTFKLNLGFIKREIHVDNNIIVFYLSFLLVGIAYLIILFIL